MNTDQELRWQALAKAAQHLVARLPAELRDDPAARTLATLRSECAGVDVVHLIYRTKHYEGDAKDYEFSRLSMEEHWRTGHADMSQTLQDPRWTQRERSTTAIRVFDLRRDQEPPKEISR